MAPRKTKKTTEFLKESSKTATETLVKPKPKKAAVKKTPAAKTTKKVSTKTAAATAVPAFDPNCYVIIDHPSNGEVISGLHYAIRIGASENGAVEICFDGGDWQPCRNAGGYWWFDWGYFTPGEHAIVARLRDNDGNTLAQSQKILCQVI